MNNKAAEPRDGSCPACGSARLAGLGFAAPAFRTGHDRHEIVECGGCGLSFSDPLPSSGEVKAFYENEETYKQVYGRVDYPWQREQHKLDLLRVAKTRGGRKGRLLDVGSSYGLLLEVACGLGWDAYGVEPDGTAVEVARNRVGPDRVFHGFLDELPGSWGDFDVVSMSHVWEHFTDFRVVVRRVVGLLKPGGILAIQAPNRRAWMTLLSGPDYRPVEHPFYWTYRAAFLVLRQAGLMPRVVPPLWNIGARKGPAQLTKELAIGVERLICPRFNLGIKSTLEIHALKRAGRER